MSLKLFNPKGGTMAAKRPTLNDPTTWPKLADFPEYAATVKRLGELQAREREIKSRLQTLSARLNGNAGAAESREMLERHQKARALTTAGGSGGEAIAEKFREPTEVVELKGELTVVCDAIELQEKLRKEMLPAIVEKIRTAMRPLRIEMLRRIMLTMAQLGHDGIDWFALEGHMVQECEVGSMMPGHSMLCAWLRRSEVQVTNCSTPHFDYLCGQGGWKMFRRIGGEVPELAKEAEALRKEFHQV